MRYYDLSIGDLTYSSRGGSAGTLAGALNVELDISVAPGDAALKGAIVTVWGIGLKDISQSKYLPGKPVTVKAGMAKGLPLANPSQAGTLVTGTVYRAWGNWVGTDQNLNVLITASAAAPETGGSNPPPVTKPIVMNWPKGQDISGPIQTALQKAFNLPVQVNLKGRYKPPSDQTHFNGALEQFSEHIRRYTQMLGGANAQGVGISFQNGMIMVRDEQQSSGGTINYQDLIGQPTWVGIDTISIKVVMRGDLKVGQKVTLPQTLVSNSGEGGHQVAGELNPRQDLTFQGDFQITGLRHVGNFRQPDAASWVTIIEANTASS